MHEGFSDYFAATIRNDPKIGNGFRGPGTSIRDIEIDRVWPDDLVGESHADGLIIACALWDLRKRVGREVADHLWHFARYGRSTTFDDYLLDLLVLDDDVLHGDPHEAHLAGLDGRLHGLLLRGRQLHGGDGRLALGEGNRLDGDRRGGGGSRPGTAACRA